MTIEKVFSTNQEKRIQTILRKEISPLKDKIFSFEKKTEARFNSTEKRLDSMDTRLGSLENKVGSLENKVGSLENKVESLEGKVDSLEGKVESLGKNVENLNYTVISHGTRLNAIEERLEKTLTQEFFLEYMDAFLARQEANYQELMALKSGSLRHEVKIEKLEKTSQRHSVEIQSLTIQVAKKKG